VLTVALCLSVCYKSQFCQNGWTVECVLNTGASFHLSYNGRKFLVTPKIRVLPPGTLSQSLDFFCLGTSIILSTRISATADGPRDALFHSESCRRYYETAFDEIFNLQYTLTRVRKFFENQTKFLRLGLQANVFKRCLAKSLSNLCCSDKLKKTKTERRVKKMSCVRHPDRCLEQQESLC